MYNQYPTLDVQHQRNSEYESSTLEEETCWSRDVIDQWMEGCADLVAENFKKTLAGKTTQKVSTRLPGTRPEVARAVQRLALKLGAQQQDVRWEHIEASIRYW